jgi:tetratricopeptide (TPR) repeat protein
MAARTMPPAIGDDGGSSAWSHIMNKPLLLSLLCAVACAPAFAADYGDPTPAATAEAPDKLSAARAHIKAARWTDAVTELKKVNDTRSGDWNNLMGFAQRKLAPPDLAAAERYYDAALKIAPAHRGALEYSGELYLMKGELPRAEARLAELVRVCAGPCEEHADLKRAIDRFKANGNKFVAVAR